MMLVIVKPSMLNTEYKTTSHAVPLKDMYKFESACKTLALSFDTFLENGECIQSYNANMQYWGVYTPEEKLTEAKTILEDYRIIAVKDNGTVITRANQRPKASRRKSPIFYKNFVDLPEDGRNFEDDIL